MKLSNLETGRADKYFNLTCLWVAPIAYPAEGMHTWDEQAGDWVVADV